MRDRLQEYDPEVFDAILGEERRQQTELELIPSENYTYPEVLAALGTVFTNKYSEGYPGNRYYGGQTYTDALERLACARACELFGAEYANVQALSGAPMNQAVYYGLLEPGDSILAMDLTHGGHLTHGSPVSHMARVFRFHRYKANAAGRIDFERGPVALPRKFARSWSCADTRRIPASWTTWDSSGSPTRLVPGRWPTCPTLVG